jgi:hypothetical protein
MSGRPAKLSQEAVIHIRLWAAAVKSLPGAHEMAKRHGVCTSTLYRVAREVFHKVQRG